MARWRVTGGRETGEAFWSFQFSVGSGGGFHRKDAKGAKVEVGRVVLGW
jgi:hypothetical protein